MDQRKNFIELLASAGNKGCDICNHDDDCLVCSEAGAEFCGKGIIADHLIANGAVIVPSIAGKVFPFRKGCLPRRDWGEVVGACKVIGEAVWDAPSGGFTDNGVDYIPVDLMREPVEVEEALCTVIAFFRQVYGFDVYEKMAAFDESEAKLRRG